MATKLDQFPITPRRTQRSYPWEKWTDGGAWMLIRGEDFDQEVEVFRNKLYSQATKRGLKVRTHKEQTDVHRGKDGREVLFVQFYGHTPPHSSAAGDRSYPARAS
jgi:hypothetical protein